MERPDRTRDAAIITVIALAGALAAILAAIFCVPAGAADHLNFVVGSDRSNAYNLDPANPNAAVMDFTAHPFQYLGTDPRFCAAFNARYGRALQNQPGLCQLPDTHAHGHSSDTIGYLLTVCNGNPSWFAGHGYGSATPPCSESDVSEEEANDGSYAAAACDAVYCESQRLNGIHFPGQCNNPIVCGDSIVSQGETCRTCRKDWEAVYGVGSCTVVPPPVTVQCTAPKVCVDQPVPCPTCPTLAAVPSDVRETVELLDNWLAGYHAGAARQARVARVQAWLRLVESYKPTVSSTGTSTIKVCVDPPKPCATCPTLAAVPSDVVQAWLRLVESYKPTVSSTGTSTIKVTP